MRVIILREGDGWVAQCLEHDICVQADSIEQLYSRFQVVRRLESEQKGGLERINPAPEHFFRMWNRRAGSFAPVEALDEGVDFGIAA